MAATSKTRKRADAVPKVDIHKALAAGEIAPVYYLYGDEQFLVDETVNDILSAALPDKTQHEFNLDIISGAEVEGKDVVAVASSFPMMGDRRVVIVRDFDRLTEKERLEPLLENPPPGNVLVMIGTGMDRRLAIFKTMEKRAVCRQFDAIRDYEIPDWIKNRVEKAGKSIQPDALQLMQLYSDRSLRDIQNEIDKLFLFVADRKAISIADVNAIVGDTREYNIFELQKTLGERNTTRSMEILSRMMDTGEAPIGIVAGLTKYYQKLWVVQELRRKGKQKPDIASFLKLNPMFTRFIDEYIQAAGKFHDDDFPRIFRALLETDIALKSSRMDAYLAMTLLLSNLTASK